MNDIGLTHIALPVRSLQATIAFYARYAAMQLVHQRPGVIWLSDRTRPFVLVFFEVEDSIIPLAQHAHLGVGVASRAEVDRLCQQAEAEGCLERAPSDAGAPVGYWAILRDPDGHRLELAFGQEVGLTLEHAQPGA